ncbi:unnamed protein product [Symbiodinium necroappetens]|uniref:Glycosyl transferase family 25 domain-containing protein n=1 Tax=Symbiodinium necroappetens TaxID=1628268 RepID=A0A812KKZ2_9DINO|nr:unnamed protein product [Symbiodinium necroappetens]
MALVSAGACPPALLGGRAVRRLGVRTKTFARNGFGSGGFAIGSLVFAGRIIARRRHSQTYSPSLLGIPSRSWGMQSTHGWCVCRLGKLSQADRDDAADFGARHRPDPETFLQLSPSFWDDLSDPGQEWCALYINLARRPDRREKLLEKLAVSNAELRRQIRRIDAVDGRWLRLLDDAVAEIVDEYALDKARHARRRGAYTIVHSGGRLLHFDNHLTVGGIACAMSHRLALQALVSHPTAKWGIILEDDILEVVPRVEEVVAKAISNLPEDWDALFLGYHDDAGRAHHSAYEGHEDEADVAEVPVRLLREPCFGLFAWVVRREAAEALLAHAFPIGGQVDHALSSWLLRERGRCFQVEPGSMVCFSPKSEEAEDSDIQTMATVDDFMGKFQSWQAYYVPWQHSMLRNMPSWHRDAEEHVWGMDAMMDEYILGESTDFGDMDGYQESGDWDVDDFLTPFPSGGSSPPCDAPAPECYPGDYDGP